MAWEIERRLSRNQSVRDLYAVAGRSGRLGQAATIVRSPRLEGLQEPALAITPRGAAILAWSQLEPRRREHTRVRYSVLAP